MSASAIKAGEIAVDTTVTGITESAGDLKRLARELQKTANETKKTSAGIAKYTKVVSQLVALRILVGIGTQVFNVMKQVADRVDEVAKAADRMNMSVKETAQLGTLASLGGASLKQFETGIAGMNRQIGNLKMGSSEAKEVFHNLGITMEDLQGKSTLEQFKMISDGINQFSDESDRASMRMKVFGKSGNMLANMTNKGADGIDSLTRSMEELGIGPSQEMVGQMTKFKDLMTVSEAKFNNIKDTVVAALVPAINEMIIGMIAFADTSTDAWQKMSELMAQLYGSSQENAESFSMLTAALDVLALVMTSVSNAIMVLRIVLYTVIGALTKVMSLFGHVYDWILKIVGLETDIGGFLENFSEDSFGQVADDANAISKNVEDAVNRISNMGTKMGETEDRAAEIRRLFEDMNLGNRQGQSILEDYNATLDETKDKVKDVGKELKKALNISGAFSGQAVVARGAAGINASRNAQMAQWTKYLKMIAKNTEDAATIQGI
jgi:methyl-accepting chemotaxis protein